MVERVLSMHEVAGSIPAFSRILSASGLVVKSNVANVGPWVRFPAGAIEWGFSSVGRAHA